MAYSLPELPYDANSLEPNMSVETVIRHYSKHHQGYVDKLNATIKGTDQEDQTLESIIEHGQKTMDSFLFNNAAQIWNHNFFWSSMTPEKTEPSDLLKAELESAFGGIEGFQRQFKEAATGLFGSGWTWLVKNKDGLSILNTSNADLPLLQGVEALVCCDVWEHAYYLDYKNERDGFVDAFLQNLMNWEFASKNFAAASEGRPV